MKRRKKIFILTASVATAAVVIVTGLYFRADAETIWRLTRNASLATLRAPHDAALRFIIGNYYFGDGAYDPEKAETYFRKLS